MERDTLADVIGRMNGQIQDINGIYALCCVSIDVYRIIENTAVEVLVTAPHVVVSFAYRHFVGVRVRHRCSCLVTNSKAVDAVATETACMTLLVDTVVVDGLAAPCSCLTRN